MLNETVYLLDYFDDIGKARNLQLALIVIDGVKIVLSRFCVVGCVDSSLKYCWPFRLLRLKPVILRSFLAGCFKVLIVQVELLLNLDTCIVRLC
jgi:hypothetical protein